MQLVKIITIRVCSTDIVAASIVIILNASEKHLLKMENVHEISTKTVLHLNIAPTGKVINVWTENVRVLVEKVKVDKIKKFPHSIFPNPFPLLMILSNRIIDKTRLSHIMAFIKFFKIISVLSRVKINTCKS